MGLKDALKQPFVRQIHREYKKKLEMSKDSFEEFVCRQEKTEAGIWENISAQDAEAINNVEADLLFIKVSTGKLSDNARKVFARYFYEFPEAVLAYCDEFWVEDGDIKTSFKPDWSPDTFLDRFYFDGLVVVRKSVFEKVVPLWEQITEKQQWWQEIERFLKIKNGFNKLKKGGNPVVHIPQLLYEIENAKTGQVIVEWNKNTCVIKGEGEYSPSDIAVIIPSKDHPLLLEKCIGSLRRTVDCLNIKVIVVDNGSSSDNRRQIEKLSKELDFKYIYKEMPFNFAKMCNLGAAEVTEEQLLFLNDDIECIHAGWLEEMSEVASRPYVGAVGSKLLYPDGKRIQHAGITNLPIGPVHKLQFLEDDEVYYDEYNRGVRNVIAVTGACLLMRRKVYEEVGGMNEALAVAFNDVELCFKLYEKGYYQVVLQDKPLYHHESLSRGDDESTEKWQRLMAERAKLYALHPKLEGKDPFYNINLNRIGLDVRIVPEYVQGRQCIELVCPKPASPEMLKGAREDKCLMVRAEICRESVDDSSYIELYGYGVVLGSDNALFSKKILLKKEDGSFYAIPLSGQYRADLIRNMPDQINIGMSGFWINIMKADLAPGRYEVGILAADRTSRMKLFSFTGRIVEI